MPVDFELRHASHARKSLDATHASHARRSHDATHAIPLYFFA